MSFLVEYSRFVEDEVKEIVDWYKEKSHSAAFNFLSHLNQAEKKFIVNPFAYREVSGSGIRRIALKKYPYKVYFRITISTIYILAVTHQSRSNRYIRSRLKK